MDLQRLIDGLSDSSAWPRPQKSIEVVQTHASVVFLGDDEVYKIKKPVDFGFLDYSSLEKRRLACEAEVRLNRRLAPGVYLGVEPITSRLRFGGGNAVEWSVHMRRLPEERTFRSLLEAGALDAGLLRRLAHELAAFFDGADAGPGVSAAASFPAVERNLLENFEEAAVHVGTTVTEAVLDRFRSATESELDARRATIEARAARGVARDGHGDLRLDHAYEIDGELLVVDCIEFNDRFRHQDPVCDIAFLVMELEFAGRRDLARIFVDAFVQATGDEEGRALLPLYLSYRHAVRGKVRSLEAAEEEVLPERRNSARRGARAHFLAGLAVLSPPERRPALLLVGGPPACGKSTLARRLQDDAGFERISSDETRKRLAGLAPTADGAAAFGEGIYTREWTQRTYDACLRMAREKLLDGGRVVVDASFGEDAKRSPFLELAAELGLPALWLDLELPAEEAARRLRARSGDASDADESVQARAQAAFEPPGPSTLAYRRGLDASGTPDETAELALTLLREAALA